MTITILASYLYLSHPSQCNLGASRLKTVWAQWTIWELSYAMDIYAAE